MSVEQSRVSLDLSAGDESHQGQSTLASELVSHCDCPCCTDVHSPHHPKDLINQGCCRCMQVARGKTAHQSLTPGPFKQLGMLSTSGSASVPPHSQSSVLSAVVRRVMG